MLEFYLTNGVWITNVIHDCLCKCVVNWQPSSYPIKPVQNIISCTELNSLRMGAVNKDSMLGASLVLVVSLVLLLGVTVYFQTSLSLLQQQVDNDREQMSQYQVLLLMNLDLVCCSLILPVITESVKTTSRGW